MYRKLGRQAEFHYNREFRSEVTINGENDEYSDSDHQGVPSQLADTPKPSKVSRLRPKGSTVMTEIQNLVSASASTVSLAASRLLKPRKDIQKSSTMKGLGLEHCCESSCPNLENSSTIGNASEKTLSADHVEEGPGMPMAIAELRAETSWMGMSPECKTLEFDLFCPHDPKDLDADNMPRLRDLAPMRTFHHLRSLKLTGMLQSYQKCIWETVWLNPELEDLELDMALAPSLHGEVASTWNSIDCYWKGAVEEETTARYFGDNGQGTLHKDFGFGEYLDKLAIMDARGVAWKAGGKLRKLPVINLTLSGFVVDGNPFFMLFDAHRLRTIRFKCDCVDAGFALPIDMRHVKVRRPVQDPGYRDTGKVVQPQSFKLVDVQNGLTTAHWDPEPVGQRLRSIKRHFAAQREQQDKDIKGKGKAVDYSQSGEAEYLLNQSFPFNPAPSSPPRRRRRGFSFFSRRIRP